MPTPGTVEFPTALDNAVSLFEVNNRAYTTLSADINNSVLAIPLTDSTVFPTTGVVTLTDSLTAPTKHEEIIFTANAANSLTVPVGGRGAFGSTAQNWSGTVYVRMRMIAEHHEVLRDAVIQLETKLGYGAATPTNGKFLVGNTTAGTSTWRVLAAGDIPDLSGTYALSGHNHSGVYEPANANIQLHIGSTSNPHNVTKSQVGLGNVENTALSTWAGSANMTTLGTIGTGTWNGSVIGSSYGGAGSVNGILKANGSGVVSAAVAGTDYLGVTAPGSSGQLLYNNANAYAAVAGSAYSASADHSLSFTPTTSKTGVLIYEPTSTAPATVRLAQSLIHLHVLNGTSYWALGYSSDATTFEWANYLNDDGSLLFSVSDGVTSGETFLYPQGLEFSTPFGGSYYGGMAGVSADQFGLMLTTATPSSGAVFPLTWRTTGITQAAPATALADGSVPVNHLHFYQDEATNELKCKWKESGGSVNTITFGSGGASNPFDDATAIIKGSADATKLLRIEVDGLTTATTRVWTAPDANLTVVGADTTQTLTNKTITALNSASTIAMGGGSGTMRAAGSFYVTAPNATTSGTTEQTLDSCTIPANSFNANTRAIWVRAYLTTAGNTNSKTAKITFGSATIETKTGVFNNQTLVFDVMIIRSGSGTQETFTWYFRGAASSWSDEAIQRTATTVTDTSDIILAVKATTPTAAGDITLRGFSVQFLN